MSAALRNSIQRQVTGLLVRSRWCTRPLSAPSSTGMARNSMSPGTPETGAVGDHKNADQPDEPAAPDGNPSGIQDHVRVGQGAPAQPRAVWIPPRPSASRGSWSRVGCQDALRQYRPNASVWPRNPAVFYHAQGLPEHVAPTEPRKSARSTVSKRERRIFPFSPSETPEGHAIILWQYPKGNAEPVGVQARGVQDQPGHTTGYRRGQRSHINLEFLSRSPQRCY